MFFPVLYKVIMQYCTELETSETEEVDWILCKPIILLVDCRNTTDTSDTEINR